MNNLDLRALDGFLVRVTARKPLIDMYDDVLLRVARAFNGDDSFLAREMLKRASMMSPNHVEQQVFTSVIRYYQPSQASQLSLNDVMFLARKYTNEATKLVDINAF
jgi:hypothetical protein